MSIADILFMLQAVVLLVSPVVSPDSYRDTCTFLSFIVIASRDA
jgi:hypothetical protein